MITALKYLVENKLVYLSVDDSDEDEDIYYPYDDIKIVRDYGQDGYFNTLQIVDDHKTVNLQDSNGEDLKLTDLDDFEILLVLTSDEIEERRIRIMQTGE